MLRLSSYYWYAVSSEYWTSWKQNYLTKRGVKNKTVLDVGAGCGETAAFYFEHGAKKVICVENDRSSLKMLEFNKAINEWNAEIVHAPFSAQLLSCFNFDFLKFDCEGCEIALADVPSIPCEESVGEIHGTKLLLQLQRIHNFQVRKALKSEEFGWLYYVYSEKHGQKSKDILQSC
jgi:predicted methyltransferase